MKGHEKDVPLTDVMEPDLRAKKRRKAVQGSTRKQWADNQAVHQADAVGFVLHKCTCR